MAVFKAAFYVRDDLQAIDQEYSVNFHISTGLSSDTAWGYADNIAQAYSGILIPDSCTVYKVTINNPDVVNGVQSRDVEHIGARVVSGSALPSWNTIKFQAKSALGGRPSTFHFRVGLTENDVSGQNLVTAMVDSMDDFITALGLQNSMCKPDGSIFSIYSFDQLVRNRQQGWHRRTRPGFKRGWVPV